MSAAKGYALVIASFPGSSGGYEHMDQVYKCCMAGQLGPAQKSLCVPP